MATRTCTGSRSDFAELRVEPARTIPLRVLLRTCAALITALTPSLASAQQITLTGTVVERGDGTPVAAASVRLSGHPETTTDRAGRFEFGSVSPGEHTLTVVVFGYRPTTLALTVTRDTAVTIELEPDPVPLDSLRVEAATVTVRGVVRDSTSGQRLLQGAAVTRYPGSREVRSTSGRFTMENVPKGEPIGLLIEAFEYLPKRIELVVENDTTLDILLSVDSVALRMIAQQVERLETRSFSIPHRVESIGRDEFRRSGTATLHELVRRRLPPGLVDGPRFPDDNAASRSMCVLLDDMPSRYREVQYIQAELIERIEIVQRGRMIRVYTKRYVRRMMGMPQLAPIIYATNGPGLSCW